MTDHPAPRHLSPESRRLWRETVRIYSLEAHHLILLEQACRTLDAIAEAEAAIVKDGAYLPGRFGVRSHPAAAVRDRNRIVFARIVRELNLDLESTPASRPPSPWRT